VAKGEGKEEESGMKELIIEIGGVAGYGLDNGLDRKAGFFRIVS
jgi:hypothetical protein